MGNTPPPHQRFQDTSTIHQKRRRRIKETREKMNPPKTVDYNCKLKVLQLIQINRLLKIERDVLTATGFEDCEKNHLLKAVDQIKGTPLNIGTLEEFVDFDKAIVSPNMGPEMLVPIMSFVDADKLDPGSTVLLNYRMKYIVGTMEGESNPAVMAMKLDTPPTETYNDIGGLEKQIQEIKESVELPLTNPELFAEMGITPPKGVILYGEPGTGKTLLAKAVANATSATFIRIVGSELIKQYLGEGPKLVRDIFKLAKEKAPSIIFIDEVDAIGRRRYNSQSSGAHEIQRTMLELLNQLDGFDKSDIKVIMATNLISVLDPALIRPGRIDRKIEFTLPTTDVKLRIFKIHTKKMTLDKDVDLNDLASSKEDLSGADIKAICMEAGLLALRDRRGTVTIKDFTKGKEKVFFTKKASMPDNLYS
ncbi:26S proteasome regulatory subunit 4 like protein [Cucumispora dikerogammari]|nr:26S proteasome regulatory subunit 4 like protein [Cucumispora dikerogammari]